MNKYLQKNYSQDDLRKLINEGQNKNKNLNKLINNDIYIKMISESYLPAKDNDKYLNENYNSNSRYFLISDSEKMKIGNKNRFNIFHKKEKENMKENKINQRYIKNNINNSFNYNRPLYEEKKHFPLLMNRGNYLKVVNQSLIPSIERSDILNENHTIDHGYNKKHKRIRNKFIQRNHDYNKIKFKSYNYCGNSEYKIKEPIPHMPINLNGKNLRKKIINFDFRDLDENSKLNNTNSQKEKHYNPRRFDYEGSRFGDVTYNYYLNGPMRGDASSINWKFPPLYCYNSKIDYGKSFPDL